MGRIRHSRTPKKISGAGREKRRWNYRAALASHTRYALLTLSPRLAVRLARAVHCALPGPDKNIHSLLAIAVLGKSSGLVTSRGVLEATAVALCDASQQQQEEDGPEW